MDLTPNEDHDVIVYAVSFKSSNHPTLTNCASTDNSGDKLYWDADSEEGVLLIHWASRRQWHGIATAEVERVQERFDQLARQGTGRSDPQPFPLLFSGELIAQ